MHPPIREDLESYLAGKPTSAAFQEHLSACAECRTAVRLMERQSRILRTLRPIEEVEPAPGFYARVLERIEMQKAASIWSVFLEPVFARRLIYASAVLTLLLGVLLFTSPREETALASSVPEQILAEEVPRAQLVDIEQDRNTVFVQLSTYQE